MRIGIDIGGVIIDRANDGTDTSFFGDNYLRTTQVSGAFEGIKQLVDSGAECFIVSKAGTKTQERSCQWLVHHNFFRQTGFDSENLRFCKERYQKHPIAEELKLTHFIDDKLEVLGYLVTVPNLYLFNPTAGDLKRNKHHLHKVIRHEFWHVLVEDILK